MTDEIITQLAQIRDLKVISRTSVVALKGSHLTFVAHRRHPGRRPRARGIRPPRWRSVR